jgi:D-alanine-D-alanine ligase
MILNSEDIRQPTFEDVKTQLGTPFFIKPAKAGSSLGVSRVVEEADYDDKLLEAFKYDHNVLIEEGIVGRELELCVIGNKPANIKCSLPGEVFVSKKYDFYSYDAKYDKNSGCYTELPANLTPEELKLVQDISIRAYKILCCEVLTRVDLFLIDDNTVYVNEVNTVPGCTDKSMFPLAWDASGIEFPDVLDTLVNLAIERFHDEEKLET